MNLFSLLDATQGRLVAALDAALDPEVATVGLRRLRVLQLLPDEGARQTDLAVLAGVTKQAVAEHVEALTARGLVVRTQDPTDARALLVTLTREGASVRRRLEAAIAQVEAECEQHLGPDRYADLRTLLTGVLPRTSTSTSTST